jgi:hypothetical protein
MYGDSITKNAEVLLLLVLYSIDSPNVAVIIGCTSSDTWCVDDFVLLGLEVIF